MVKTIRKRISVLLTVAMLLQLLVGVAPVVAEDAGAGITAGVTASDSLQIYEAAMGEEAGIAAFSQDELTEEDMEEADAEEEPGEEIVEDSIEEIAEGNTEESAEAKDEEIAEGNTEEPAEEPVEESEEESGEPVESPAEDPTDGTGEDSDADIEAEGIVEADTEKAETAGAVRTFGMAPMSAEVVATYNLGKYSPESVTGTLYSDGKLVVSGSGPMNENMSNPFAPNQSSIISVVINSGVTTIGAYMFTDCTSLTSVTIPNSVTSIGYETFRGCTSLTSVTIPNLVTSIPDKTFYNCTSLTSVTIPNSVKSIEFGAFGNCSALASVTIPNSVTSIGNSAFTGCTSLGSVTFPNSVVSIGEYVFYNCTSLASVTIPYSLESIGAWAFYNCTNLITLYVPDNPPTVGNLAFAGCPSNRNLIIVDAAGEALTGEDLTSAQNAYRNAADGNINNNNWYGWIIVPLITPIATDFTYDFSASPTYTGSSQAVAVTSSKTGMGIITIKYNGSTTPPENAGTYSITIDVAKGEYYTSLSGCSLGTYTINKATPVVTGTAQAITNAEPASVITTLAGITVDGVGGLLEGSWQGTAPPGYNTTQDVIMTFTPTDTTNYNNVTTTVSVTTKPTYSVTFNANGGTGDPPSQGATPEDDTFLLPENPFVNEGYSFAGWNDGTETYSAETTYNMPARDIIFAAQWAPLTYSITYHLDEGTNYEGAPNSYTIETDTITLLTPVKTGYTFDGWYDAATEGTKIESILQGSKGDITLYARWTAIDYTVTYNGNENTGGTVPEDNTVYHINDPVTVLGNSGSLEREGYTFKSWNTKADGSGTGYEAGNVFAMEDDNVTLYAQWAKKITVTANSDSKTYDGEPLTNAGCTYTELLSGDSLEATIAGSRTDAGTATNVITAVRIINGETDVTAKYDIKTENGTLTVNKRAVTITANSANFIYDGSPQSDNEYTVSGLVGTDEITATVAGSITYPLESPVVNRVIGHSFTVGNANNYTVAYVEGQLTMGTAGKAITVTANSKSETYDGAPLTDDGYTSTGELFPGDELAVTVEGSRTDAGTADNVITEVKIMHDTIDVTANYNITEENGTLTVTARSLEITAGSATKAYDGTPLTKGEYAISSGSLVAGHTVASVTLTGAQLFSGSCANVASAAVIMNGDVDVTGNYNITYVDGELEVTEAEIEIVVTAKDGSKVYDGTELTNSGGDLTSGTLAAGDELAVTAAGSRTDAGTAVNVITEVKVMHGTTDVTANYNITTVDGTLTVTARPLEITAGSATKVYEGTPLTNEEFSISSGSLVTGHTVASVTLTGSQTEVGNSANVASAAVIMDGDVDVTGNYDITYVDGTLVINRKSSGGDSQVIVVVNGQALEAGKETHTFEEGKATAIVEVNNQFIESQINEAITNNPTGTGQATGNTIQIPVADTKSEVAKVGLTGDMVKKLEENAFAVSIIQDKVEYIIPTAELTINKVAENLGVAETELQEIKVEVKISKTDDPTAAKYNEMVKAKGAELLFPPVEFTIVAKTQKADGTTGVIEISRFNSFVERVIELPAGTEPNMITTGVVFNTDGTCNHVPTEVFQKDGRWYARINSLSNSAYSLIWNPATVQSVENHWAKETVNDLAARLVIFNPETFEPDQAITRADFAEYIVRALGLYREGSGYENKFTDVRSTDVPNTDPRTQAIAIAAAYRIVSGYPDGTFRPEQHITREEAMAMYQRAMVLTKLTGRDKERYQNYTDFAAVSSWAEEAVKAVLAAHVINGTSADTISPKAKLTYAESAQAIKNLLVESKLINK